VRARRDQSQRLLVGKWINLLQLLSTPIGHLLQVLLDPVNEGDVSVKMLVIDGEDLPVRMCVPNELCYAVCGWCVTMVCHYNFSLLIVALHCCVRLARLKR